MDAFFRRAAAAVAALEGDDGAYVRVADVAVWMAEQWPQAFPRPARVVDGWCQDAVEAGLLEQPEPRVKGKRRVWALERYRTTSRPH